MNYKLGVTNLIIIFITACTPAPTPQPTASSTTTQIATPTATLIPLLDLEGSLFFDYNGSGLWDEDEPPIAGFALCATVYFRNRAEPFCTDTDKSGHFLFEELAPSDTVVPISFNDPNQRDSALAFRYINQWKGPVVIEAYEMNGVHVPEQHLNDTEMVPIEKFSVRLSEENNNVEIGLTRGFLTSPLLCEQDYAIGIWYDHDPRQGYFLKYDGSTDPHENPAGVEWSSDNHDGLDFSVPIGAYVLAMAPGEVVFSDGIEVRNGISYHVTLLHFMQFATGTGHHSALLLERGQKVYRGQIIALSGRSGGVWPHIHLNLHTFATGEDPPPTMDTFGTLFGVDNNYEQNNYWTVFNEPKCP